MSLDHGAIPSKWWNGWYLMSAMSAFCGVGVMAWLRSNFVWRVNNCVSPGVNDGEPGAARNVQPPICRLFRYFLLFPFFICCGIYILDFIPLPWRVMFPLLLWQPKPPTCNKRVAGVSRAEAFIGHAVFNLNSGQISPTPATWTSPKHIRVHNIANVQNIRAETHNSNDDSVADLSEPPGWWL